MKARRLEERVIGEVMGKGWRMMERGQKGRAVKFF